jgi:hypothetical protein
VSPYGIDDLSPRGQYTECGERPAVDDGGSVHEYLELAVASVDHVHIDL